MKKQLVAAGLTTAVLASSTALGAGTAQAAPHRDKPTSLAAVLAADGHHFDHNWGDFDILDAAVTTVLKEKPKSAVGVLAQPRTKLTAFLPTDRAFGRLVSALTGKPMPKTERATFNTLAKAAGVDTIEQVLLYHVVPGKTLLARKVLQSDGAKLPTAQGATIKVRVNKGTVTLVDKEPDLYNPKVIAVNVNKGNPQIAHVINKVLLPVNL